MLGVWKRQLQLLIQQKQFCLEQIDSLNKQIDLVEKLVEESNSRKRLASECIEPHESGTDDDDGDATYEPPKSKPRMTQTITKSSKIINPKNKTCVTCLKTTGNFSKQYKSNKRVDDYKLVFPDYDGSLGSVCNRCYDAMNNFIRRKLKTEKQESVTNNLDETPTIDLNECLLSDSDDEDDKTLKLIIWSDGSYVTRTNLIDVYGSNATHPSRIAKFKKLHPDEHPFIELDDDETKKVQEMNDMAISKKQSPAGKFKLYTTKYANWLNRHYGPRN
jgi:hypothetical protein